MNRLPHTRTRIIAGVLIVALTKRDLIDQVAQSAGIPKMVATKAVEAALELIKSSLVNGDDVLISGFGKFVAKHKEARLGRYPQPGNPLMLRPRTVINFHSSGVLRELVNRDGPQQRITE